MGEQMEKKLSAKHRSQGQLPIDVYRMQISESIQPTTTWSLKEGCGGLVAGVVDVAAGAEYDCAGTTAGTSTYPS